MTKLEKVIKALECCKDINKLHCDDCAYTYNARSDRCECTTEMASDALELLKEREPVKPIDETCWNHTYGRCGHCRAPLPALEGLHSKFCWMCGRQVKWDE